MFSINAATGQLTLQSATSSITSTETPADQTIIVTVAGSPPGQYYLDGVLFANYQFTEGATYTFDLSDSSNSNHPLRFSETINGTFGGGSEYTTGVSYSGTAGQAGASTTITVTESTPQLYYYCAVHSGMGGEGLLTSQAFVSSNVDYENPTDTGSDNTYNVVIQVSDGVNTATQAITVNVTDDTSEGGVYGSISSTSLSSLELDSSYMDFGNILPVFTPPDEDFNLSSLNLNVMGFEGQINLQIESELSSFVSEREQSNEGKELEKSFTDNKLSLVVDEEVLDNLSHFSEIG